MELVRQMFTSRTAKRIHKTAAGLALLVTWAFFGTVKQVMHTGSYVEFLFWLGLLDVAACLVFGNWAIAQRISTPKKVENVAAKTSENDMEKAA